MTNFKKVRWESKKYRDAAKGQDCQMRLPCCNHDTATTVLAHRNGAGTALKASDWDAADMCSACHDALDNRANRDYHLGACLSFDGARFRTIINRIERGIIK